MSRNSTIYASAYDRATVQQSWFYPNESRTLTVDFNSAIDPERLIESATFKTWDGSFLNMSSPEISDDQRSLSLRVRSQYGGPGVITCTATLDNGDTLTQQWRVMVQNGPYYNNEGWTNGPTALSVTFA